MHRTKNHVPRTTFWMQMLGWGFGALLAVRNPTFSGPQSLGQVGVARVWLDDPVLPVTHHHSAMVVLSGHNEAYYSDYLGSPQEFLAAVVAR